MSSQSLSETRSRTLSGATLGLFGTRKRRSTLRQSTLAKDGDNGIEIVEVEYLDGKKEKGTRLTREGKVRAVYNNGDIYEGHVATNKENAYVKSGKGRYTWASGAEYDGWYRNNLKHGKGKYKTKKGITYEGVFNNGLKEGKGKYTYEDGTVFNGTWKKGKRFGKGKYLYPDGSTQTGEYENGKLLEHTKKKTYPVKQVEGPQMVIVGPPAAGTEFQGRMISEKLGVIHIMAESLIQDAAKEGSELGKKAKAYLEKSMEVPDELMTTLIAERVDKEDVKMKGYILDGFPCNVSQVRLLKHWGVIIETAIMLEVGDEVLKGKVANIPPNAQVVKHFDSRLEDYKKSSQGLEDYFHGKMSKVDGSGSNQETWDLVKGQLN